MTTHETEGGQSRFAWNHVVQIAADVSSKQEPRLRELLRYLEAAGEFCIRILNHASNLKQESAQKTVAAYLAIQAFRASSAAAKLSLEGYSDVAAGVARSVWEIQLRLGRVREHGELVALAEIYASIKREIAIREAALSDHDDDEARRVLGTWVKARADIISKAEEHGSDEATLRELSKTSIETLAKNATLRNEYDIWYRVLSQMHHGARAFLTYRLLQEAVPEGGSVLLPVGQGATIMIAVALEHLYRSLADAAMTFEDWSLASEIQHKHALLGTAIGNTAHDDAA